MMWHAEILWFLLALVLPTLVAVRCLRSGANAERAYSWMLFSQSAWVFGQAIELSLSSLDAKIWADGLQYFPMCASAVFGVVFAHRFAGLPMATGPLTAYAAVTGLGCLFYATAPLHHLAREDAVIVSADPFDTLSYGFDTGDLAMMLLFALTGVYSNVVLWRHALRAHRPQLSAALPVLVGFCLPTLALVLGLSSGIRVLGQRDFSFVVFGIGGLIVSMGLRRNPRLLIAPVARELVFDRIPDAAIVVDAQGTVLEANQSAVDLLGLGPLHETVGKRLLELKPRIDARAVLGEGEPKNVVQLNQRSLEITRERLPDFDATLVLVHDVTAQLQVQKLLQGENETLERRVEERTRQIAVSEGKFRALFDQTFQLIGILDPEGRVMEANAASLDMLGLRAEDVMGQPFAQTPWWKHSPGLQRQLEVGIQRASTGEFVRFEATHLLPSGEVRHIDFSLKPVLDDQGCVTMLIPEGRDITDLRDAEERLRQSHKLEALGRMAGGVAHDFNNLLMAISGNVELALRDAPSSDIAEYLNEAREAAHKAATLTKRLLEFGRAGPSVPQRLNVGVPLSQLERIVRRLLPDDVNLSVSVDDSLWDVRFDSTQLDQILLNLVLNARDAMPGGGNISVSARNVHRDEPSENPRPDRDWVRIDIADPGTGMTTEQLQRIFDPFFTTKEPGKGTGLGLAIVHGALEQHGGFVKVTSAVGRGSTFGLYLPRHVHLEWVQGTTPSVPDPGDEQKLVWVVDDEDLVRRTVERILTREGFGVRTFGSASALALNLSELRRPDIVLTDIAMPGMSGYDFFAMVRRLWPGVPVVFMSAYAANREREVEAGPGVGFVQKPVSAEELVGVLRAAFADSSA